MRTIRNNLLKITGVLAVMTLALSLAQEGEVSINVSESAEHGQYLGDAAGMALYIFVPDAQGASTCYDDCATNWPPLTVASADAVPTLGEGLDATLIGTVERDDGTFQVTYNGWPLYYFAGDTEMAQTNGQAVGGNWYLLNPAGEAIGMTPAG
jgi:predicted lipoprotein with Yx(FWY)xxD motif